LVNHILPLGVLFSISYVELTLCSEKEVKRPPTAKKAKPESIASLTEPVLVSLGEGLDAFLRFVVRPFWRHRLLSTVPSGSSYREDLDHVFRAVR
jgi:hypothetical protein